MNPEQMEPSPTQTSVLQAHALSDIKEGMGQNVVWTQGLQQDLAQRRASLSQDSAEIQAIQGKEVLLANIIEKEMAHQTQVSVLSQLHLWQAKEIKAQSEEIKYLSTLLERQQTMLEMVKEQQSSVSQILDASPSAYSFMARGVT